MSYDVCDPRQGHQAVNQLFKQFIKPQTSKGERGRVSWEPVNEGYRHELRKLFHGPILTDFSEQVWLLDPESRLRVRYTVPVWKEHLKSQFCPAQFDADGRELEKSTERLSDEEFLLFITECQAYGACELGIEFTERES